MRILLQLSETIMQAAGGVLGYTLVVGPIRIVVVSAIIVISSLLINVFLRRKISKSYSNMA